MNTRKFWLAKQTLILFLLFLSNAAYLFANPGKHSASEANALSYNGNATGVSHDNYGILSNAVMVPPVAVNDTVTIDEDNIATGSVATNDSDPDNLKSELTYTQIGSITAGIFDLKANGNYTFTPNKDYNGVVVATYRVCDPGGLCSQATLTIIINPVNDRPDAQIDVVNIEEDTPWSGSVSTNDYDPDHAKSQLTYRKIGVTTEWNITFATNGTYIFVPKPNFNGVVAFTYEVCDPLNACDTSSLIFIISPVNDPPIALDDTKTTKEDSTITGTVRPLVFDVDNAINELTFAPVDVTPNGSVFNINPTTGTYTFTPAPNFSGTVVVRYKVCDPSGACDTASITITISPVNDAPDAKDDNISVPEDNTLNNTVAANDSDVDDAANTLVYMALDTPTEGAFTMNPNGSYTFIPRPNFTGMVTIRYKVCDPAGLCDTAILKITVTPVNDPPAVTVTPVTVDEDDEVTACFPITDVDAGDTHTASICGTINGDANVVIDNGKVCMTYYPDPDFNGKDTVCITVCDSGGACVNVQVPITVNPTNDAPYVPTTPITTPEDKPVVSCYPIIDIDTGDKHTASICGVTNGTATVTVVGTQVCITYTPTKDFNGDAEICLNVTDSTGAFFETIIPITVTPVNDAPVVTVTPISVNEDKTTFNNCFNVTDIDNVGDPITATICGTSNGTATVSTNGGQVCVNYTPNPNFNGKDTICIRVCDAGGACTIVPIPVTVNPVNDEPTVATTPIIVAEDKPSTRCFPITDVDTGDTHTASICGAPKNGTASVAVLAGQVCLTYTPTLNYNGPDSVCIKVCDAAGACVETTVKITVTDLNDPPVVIVNPVSTPEDSPITTCFNITDQDAGDTHTATICTPAQNGNATVSVIAGQACLTYTPNANFNGKDSVCIRVCDSGGACVETLVPITVTPVNDKPTVTIVPVSVDEDNTKNTCFVINDIDSGDTFTATTCGAKNGSATATVVAGLVCIVYTPNRDFNGIDTVCLSVCDAAGACVDTTVIINVLPVNDAPIVTTTPMTTDEDKIVTSCFPITDVDTGDTHTASICTQAKNGTASVNVVNGQVCVTYIPNPDFVGKDSACIKVCDAAGACVETTVLITVKPVNDPPSLTVTPLTTSEDSTITECFKIKDVDIADTHTATDCGISTGTVMLTVAGGYVCMTYTPGKDFNGKDEVCIRLCDSSNACVQVKIPITVTPKNDTPSVAITPVVVEEDTTVTTCFTINDPDVGDVYNASVCGTTNGKAIVTVVNGTVCMTYTPNPDFNGKDSVCIKVCDAADACVEVKIPITVTPKNDPPTVVINTPVNVNLDYTTTQCFTITDVDANDKFTATVCGAKDGVATVEVKNNQLCITYKSVTNTNGKDTICITVCDSSKVCTQVFVPVIISECVDLTLLTMNCPQPMEVNLIGDVLADPGKFLTASSIADNCQGTVLTFKNPVATHDCGNIVSTQISGLPSGSIFPAGQNTLIFEAKNKTGQTVRCTSIINIKPITLVNAKIATYCPNEQISLAAQAYTGGTYTWKKDNKTVSQNTQLLNKLATADESGQYVLSASFSNCTLKDTITVNVNAIPEANNDAYYMASDDTLRRSVIVNDTILKGSNAIIRLTTNANSLKGSLSFNNDGTFIYKPKNGFSGVEAFNYEVCYTSCPNNCSKATAKLDITNQYRGTNVITPNDDGDNDSFILDGYDPNAPGSELSEIIFYNQWGDIVHRTKGYKNDWKGYYKDAPLPSGTYYFFFKKNPNASPIKGFVTILR